MTQLDKNLSQVFDVVPISETDKPAADVVVTTEATDVTPVANLPAQSVDPQEKHDVSQAQADHEVVRQNMLELIDKGKIALESALDVVNQTDAPRAFEVFAGLLQTMGKLNMDLEEFHRRKQNLKNMRTESGAPEKVVNNNAIFVGSTAELNKFLGNMKKESK